MLWRPCLYSDSIFSDLSCPIFVLAREDGVRGLIFRPVTARRAVMRTILMTVKIFCYCIFTRSDFFHVIFFPSFFVFYFLHILAADDARKEFNAADTASNDAEREIRFEDS